VNRSAGQTVAGYSALTHKAVLHVIGELDDAALSEGSGRASSIGFQLVANRSLGLQAWRQSFELEKWKAKVGGSAEVARSSCASRARFDAKMNRCPRSDGLHRCSRDRRRRGGL